MSEGTRCDGCKEMILREGEDYLEMTVERLPARENGQRGYYTSVAKKHFHNRACLQEWVGAIGWWDGPFADGVSHHEKPSLSDTQMALTSDAKGSEHEEST